MAVARAARLANAAADVPLGAHPLADGRSRHGTANLNHAADEFMARRDAELDAAAAPGVPFINVSVGAADAGVRHGDERFLRADLRHRSVLLQPQARLILELADREHRG